MLRVKYAAALLAAALSVAGQASTVHAYGPGGPAPAMKEAAAAFKARTGVDVVVSAGPTPQWIDAARGDADVGALARQLQGRGPAHALGTT